MPQSPQHRPLVQSSRTKYFTRTLAQSTSLEHSHDPLDPQNGKMTFICNIFKIKPVYAASHRKGNYTYITQTYKIWFQDLSGSINGPREMWCKQILLQYSSLITYHKRILSVGFEVLSAVVTKIAIFWDMAPCSPYMNGRFGGTYHYLATS
jgi:hypothetical protein